MVALSCLLAASCARADPTNGVVAGNPDAEKGLVESMHPRTGEIDLRSGTAKLRVPEGFSFLNADDANKVLVRLWGNPPQDDPPLGMIYPAGTGIAATNFWAIVLHYDEDGHVSDEGADRIDAAKLLADLQRAAGAASATRTNEGFPSIEITRWAAPPRYDAATHRFHWAKEVRFGGGESVLNYNIRVLGRRGTLVLNAVASIARLAEVEAAMPEMLKAVEFEPGYKYADFEPGKDKAAPYGLVALVSGETVTTSGLGSMSPKSLNATKGLLALVAIGGVAFLWKRTR